MKKTIYYCSFVAFTLFCISCMGASLSGKNSKVYSQKLFENQTITGLDITSAYDVYLSQGDKSSVVIEVPERFKENVDCTLSDGILKITLKGNTDNLRLERGENFKATVVCNSLDYLSLMGSADLYLQSDLSSSVPRFKLNMSGSSDLVSGNHSLTLNGTDAQFTLSGSCDFEAPLKIAGESSFTISGSPDFISKLESASKVTFNVSGSCDVYLSGSAPSMYLKASGSTDCNISAFEVKTATVEAYGSCDVYVNVTDSLDVKSSGSSDVYVTGKPKIQMATSGSSSIQTR